MKQVVGIIIITAIATTLITGAFIIGLLTLLGAWA